MKSKLKYVDPFVIEHPSFGMFVGWRFAPDPVPSATPMFRRSAKRSEGWRFKTFAAALKEMQKFPRRWRKAYVHKLGSEMAVYQPSLSKR